MELKNNIRQGKIHMNTNGSIMEIVNYRNSRDVDILITTEHSDGKIYKYIAKHRTYNSFLTKSIKSPYDISICDIAYVGEGTYNSNDDVYIVYLSMIRRSLMTKCKSDICKEWTNFQTFASWYENSSYYVENEDLIMYRLNPYKREYSPDNYILIPSNIAKSIQCYLNNKSKKAKIVTNKYINMIHENRRVIYYKSFDSKKEAETNYNMAKYNIIFNLIIKYKDIIP